MWDWGQLWLPGKVFCVIRRRLLRKMAIKAIRKKIRMCSVCAHRPADIYTQTTPASTSIFTFTQRATYKLTLIKRD